MGYGLKNFEKIVTIILMTLILTGVTFASIVDTTPPEIKLIGKDTLNWPTGISFIEPGAIVTDNVDTGLNYSVLYFDTTTMSYVDAVDTTNANTVYACYQATDTAGNVSNSTAMPDETPCGVIRQINVMEDTQEPQMTLIGDELIYLEINTPFVDPGVNVTDDVDQDLNYNVIYFDQLKWGYVNSITNNYPNTYYVCYYATDTSGKITTAEAMGGTDTTNELYHACGELKLIEFYDDTAPEVTITSPANNTKLIPLNTTIQLNFSAKDDSISKLYYEILVNGEQNSTGYIEGGEGTVSKEIVLPNTVGDKNITVLVTDGTEINVGSAEINVIVFEDTEAPTIEVIGETIISLESDKNYIFVEPTVIVTDNFDTNLSYTLSFYSWVTDSWVDKVELSVPGQFLVFYSAKDSSGNEANVGPITVPIKYGGAIMVEVIDTNAPTITINTPIQDQNTNNAKINLDFSATDNSTANLFYEILVNGIQDSNGFIEGGEGTVSKEIVLPQIVGQYDINVIVSDMDSINTSSQNVRVNVIDNTSPTLELIGSSLITIPINGTYVEEGAIVSDNFDELNYSITYSTDNNSVDANSINTTIPGVYSVLYSTTDLSGNKSEVMRTIIVFNFNLSSGSFTTGINSKDTNSIVVTSEMKVIIPRADKNSEIIIPVGTTITRTDGNTMNSSELIAKDLNTDSISGLGTGYVANGVLKWGLENLGLDFSNAIQVHLYVGTEHNGETLTVYRSVSGTSDWTTDGIVAPGTCVVTAGYCDFNSTKASYYAATTYTAPVVSSSGGGSRATRSGVLTPAVTPTPVATDTETVQPTPIVETNNSNTNNSNLTPTENTNVANVENTPATNTSSPATGLFGLADLNNLGNSGLLPAVVAVLGIIVVVGFVVIRKNGLFKKK